MDNLIPIEDVIEVDPRVIELERQGFIIKPDKNIDILDPIATYFNLNLFTKQHYQN